MDGISRVVVFFWLTLILGCTAIIKETETYDTVLRGGRVIDPETGLDAVRNVAISKGRIAAISSGPLLGKTTLDVSSQVVSPGFIDLHSHSPTPLGLRYQALDGVTTSLEREAGAYPVGKYGSHLMKI